MLPFQTQALNHAQFLRRIPNQVELAVQLGRRCLVLPTTGSADHLLRATLADPEAAGRERNPHITASSVLFDADLAHVALLFHRKRQEWFYPGGHADGDWNWCGVALKECTEELAPHKLHVGWTPEDLWPTQSPEGQRGSPTASWALPRLVVRHEAKGHHHIDCVYALMTPSNTLQVAPEEGEAWRWFSLHDIAEGHDHEPQLSGVTRLVIAAMAAQAAELQWSEAPRS